MKCLIIILALGLSACAHYSQPTYFQDKQKVAFTKTDLILFFIEPHMYVCDFDGDIKNCNESTKASMGLSKSK